MLLKYYTHFFNLWSNCGLISELFKGEILKWCLDHSFELVDMISEDDEDHEEGIYLC